MQKEGTRQRSAVEYNFVQVRWTRIGICDERLATTGEHHWIKELNNVIYALESGIWRLMAERKLFKYDAKNDDCWKVIPLYQFSASDGEGASKYRMALLSTRRRAVKMSGEWLFGTQKNWCDSPLPWTILAGCGSVCMRSTAHKSTGDDESLPSEGSRHKTSRSLHKIPTSARGVNSGAKQSTCTVDISPNALNTSNDTIALRTTRVSSNGPSMMRRLTTLQHNEQSLN